MKTIQPSPPPIGARVKYVVVSAPNDYSCEADVVGHRPDGAGVDLIIYPRRGEPSCVGPVGSLLVSDGAPGRYWAEMDEEQ